VTDDWATVKNALRAAAVPGVDEFGRFVNNTKYFEPSGFDDVAAAPVLVALLPALERHPWRSGYGPEGRA